MPPMKMKGNAGKVKKGTLSRLIKLLFAKYKWQIILSIICIIIMVFGNLTSSVVTQKIADVIVDSIRSGKNPWPSITNTLIYMGGMYILGLVGAYTWNVTMAVTTQKFLNDLRKMIFNHMETLPIKYFDTHAHGDIMSIYTNDVDTIRQLVSQSIPMIFQTSFTVIALLFVMLSYSVWLTLIVLLGAVFMFLNTKKTGGKSSKYFVKQQHALGKVEGSIEESIDGLKVIKVFTHEDESIAEFDELNEHLCKVATIGNTNANILGPIMGNIGNFLYVLVAIVGSILLIYAKTIPNLTLLGINEITYGVVMSFLMMSRMFTNNINNFAQQINFIVLGLAGASRIFEILDEESEKDEGYVTLVHIKYNEDGTFVETKERTPYFAWRHPHGDGTVTYTELKGDIVLTEVDFGYNEEKMVLHDISIYARPGEQIALVGSTGAGKTTITNLINRFYDIADGKVRYDGININKIQKSSLRRSLGIVLQDTNLFTGTVMENIRYGRLDATDEEVYEAARIANAYDFITRLPEGFNTMLTSNGANLSQGQRQLLSIARAAIADVPVMILDEATSSIDTRTERLVQKGMDQLMEGRTVFVIAHRLSTIQNSDAIMVLEKGRIIERGSHEDLLKLKGTYYQLYTGAFELE